MKNINTPFISLSSAREMNNWRQTNKQIVFVLVFIMSVVTSAFSQTFDCPFNSKRNNGNGNCTAGGEIDFSLVLDFQGSTPNPTPMIEKIMDSDRNVLYDNTGDAPQFNLFATRETATRVKYCIEGLDAGQNNVPPGTWFLLFDNGQECRIDDPQDLPVEFVSFDAKMTQRTATLNWITASEQDNRGFEVERSRDGVRFESIGFVKGNGTTSSTNFYEFDDYKPLNGINYYRLKQHNFDGSFAYSKNCSLQNKTRSVVTVYPNPTKSSVTLIGKQLSDQQVTIINAMGQQFEAQVIDQRMDISHFPAGVYMLKLEDEEVVAKFIKE